MTNDNLFGSLVDGFLAELSGDGTTSPQIKLWQQDPVEWFVDRLGVKREMLVWSEYPGYEDHRWDGDQDPLAKVLYALAEGKDVGVESGTGTGKTFLGAGIVLWFLEVWESSNVITLAPKADQLKLHIWKEINDQWPKFKAEHPLASLTSLSIKMQGTDAWSAVGFPVQVRAGENVATKAAGFHREHMIFIFEETPGIEDPVMNAVENTCTAPHNIRCALGNPDHQQDALHKFCTTSGVVHVRISALDHPNVVLDDPNLIPGAVSREKIVARRNKYGEDSRLYRSRVRGICATEAAESVVRWQWLVEASERGLEDLDEELRTGPPALGIDVANSPNGDESAVAFGIGPKLIEVISKPCPDALILGKEVNVLMKINRVDEQNVGVDGIGVGSNTVNKLRELKKNVIDIQSSATPEPHDGAEAFLNLRAQMWWTFRLDVQHGEVIVPHDPELFQELTAPTWRQPTGKIQIESKDTLKMMLGRSPNRADAVVYWNWVRRPRQVATGLATMVDF